MSIEGKSENKLFTKDEAFNYIKSHGLKEYHAQTIWDYCNLIDGKATLEEIILGTLYLKSKNKKVPQTRYKLDADLVKGYTLDNGLGEVYADEVLKEIQESDEKTLESLIDKVQLIKITSELKMNNINTDLVDVIYSYNGHITKLEAAKLVLFSLRVDVDLPLIKLRELAISKNLCGDYEKCIVIITKSAMVYGDVTMALEELHELSDNELRYSEALQQSIYNEFYDEYTKILRNKDYNNFSYNDKKIAAITNIVNKLDLDEDDKAELLEKALEVLSY